IQAAWAKYHVLLLTAVLTGLRAGELRALDWKSVKFDERSIYVVAAASKTGRLKLPKSSAGYRKVDMPAPLAAELKAWRKLCPKAGLVFPSQTGGVIVKDNLRKRLWLRLTEYSGVRGHTFHSLRHHYASLLIAAEATPKEVQEALGHADIQTTFNTYGHLFPEDREKRQARVDRLAEQVLNPEPETHVAEDLVQRRHENKVRS
ncbi:MAG: site-specific integrase, partial [Sneathiella sp.]